MASATGIPAGAVRQQGLGEDEPLLGRVGDASQQAGRPLYHNLIIGSKAPRSVSDVIADKQQAQQ